MEVNQTSFPYEIFPYLIQKLLLDAEKSLNYPIEYLGSSILSACSVAIGNTYQAKLKENFIVKSNLYMILVGRAGDVKTHPLKFAFRKIEELDKQTYKNYENLMSEFNSLDKDTKKETDKPFYQKYILKDFTPESLIKIHTNNKKGLVILSDELFGWINNFGRYSSSGEQETYLSLWNGESISVDRKNDDPIRLDNTFVNIIGTMQTKLLPSLAKDNRNDNGFIVRFLFVLNEHPKPVLWNDNEIDRDSINSYDSLITKLLSLDFINHTPNSIPFEKHAKKHLIEYQNKKRIEYQDNDVAIGVQAKYEIYTIRFSLIIQLMFWGLENKSKDKIELFAVKKAIILTSYFFDNAMKVNKVLVNPLSKLPETLKTLYNSLKKTFTTSQILQKGKELQIPERNIYNFLSNRNIFKKVKHGVYNKY